MDILGIEGARRMAKSSLPSITPARRGSALLDAIGDQLQAVPSAMAAAPSGTSEKAAPARGLKPEPFVLRLSSDVFRQIDAAAMSQNVTMTVVIAQALKTAGFQVPAEDLVDRRKRRFR